MGGDCPKLATTSNFKVMILKSCVPLLHLYFPRQGYLGKRNSCCYSASSLAGFCVRWLAKEPFDLYLSLGSQ